MSTYKIGMMGLGVMGENLTINIERNGYPIAVYDREPEVVETFLADRAAGRNIMGTSDPETFVKSLERPRRIILLIKAGKPIDLTIEKIMPWLEKGDIIIDGGNSWFGDTERRQNELAEKGLHFIGSGTSGGEFGALWGPSLMPGGDRDAYEQIRPIWEAIAAKSDDGPCVTYVGRGGAGHFVKMVHNGIEYGDMQLIAEAYDILRGALGMSAPEMAEVFAEWNEGDLDSFLIEITSKILRVKDPETGKPLVDLVLDKAGQKGTGRWTSSIALELGVPIPTIDAAVAARTISSDKAGRVAASKTIAGPRVNAFDGDRREFIAAIRDALYASKICSYAQGMNLIRAGSKEYDWGIDLAETARIWQAGCIIRARFLGRIKDAYQNNPELPSLLLDPGFRNWVENAQSNWRRVVAVAAARGVPVLAIGSSLAYFDMVRTENLPLNLTQAQRDYFGSHTYERVDRPELGAVHTEWEELL
jgi:6-phosphogluconate dehydrogenase